MNGEKLEHQYCITRLARSEAEALRDALEKFMTQPCIFNKWEWAVISKIYQEVHLFTNDMDRREAEKMKHGMLED